MVPPTMQALTPWTMLVHGSWEYLQRHRVCLNALAAGSTWTACYGPLLRLATDAKSSRTGIESTSSDIANV